MTEWETLAETSRTAKLEAELAMAAQPAGRARGA